MKLVPPVVMSFLLAHLAWAADPVPVVGHPTTAVGVGATREAALTQALSAAVKQTVEAYVSDATVLAQKDKIISEKILSVGIGFVDKYSELSHVEEKGVHTVTILAKVKRNDLLAALKLEAVPTMAKEVDGKSAFARLAADDELGKATRDLFGKVLPIDPAKLYDITVVGEPEISRRPEAAEATVVVAVKFEPNAAAVKKYTEAIGLACEMLAYKSYPIERIAHGKKESGTNSDGTRIEGVAFRNQKLTIGGIVRTTGGSPWKALMTNDECVKYHFVSVIDRVATVKRPPREDAAIQLTGRCYALHLGCVKQFNEPTTLAGYSLAIRLLDADKRVIASAQSPWDDKGYPVPGFWDIGLPSVGTFAGDARRPTEFSPLLASASTGWRSDAITYRVKVTVPVAKLANVRHVVAVPLKK